MMERSINKKLLLSINRRAKELGTLAWSQYKTTLKAATSDITVYHLTDASYPALLSTYEPGELQVQVPKKAKCARSEKGKKKNIYIYIEKYICITTISKGHFEVLQKCSGKA